MLRVKALPVLISVPHGGTHVPREVRGLAQLRIEQILADGDEEAPAVYGTLKPHVTRFRLGWIGRAFVDLNRARDDRGPDGVVKTRTCWNEPIYREPLSEELVQTLLEQYHTPYHADLAEAAASVKLGIDGHTMAAVGPPIAADAGKKRPRACVSTGGGSCPKEWAQKVAAVLGEHLNARVPVDDPFKGGYIARSRPGGIPWMQIEIARGPWMNAEDKGAAVLAAVRELAPHLE